VTELLAVMAVVGILAAILVPAVCKVRESSNAGLVHIRVKRSGVII